MHVLWNTGKYLHGLRHRGKVVYPWISEPMFLVGA